MNPVNCLLVGRPGVGKTTLIERIAGGLQGMRIAGFFTREIRENNRRMGFRVETFDGRSATLAHVALDRGPRVGKYRVNVEDFEAVGVRALEEAPPDTDLILIDEIGRMELFSKRFAQAVTLALDSPKPVIASVMLKPNRFADALKARSDIELVEVTVGNRTRIASALVERIMSGNAVP